jgi:rRNA maturation protein Rpf1
LDTPPNKQEFTLFVTEDPQEISVLDQAIENKHFSFAIKNVDLTKMIRESKKKNRK